MCWNFQTFKCMDELVEQDDGKHFKAGSRSRIPRKGLKRISKQEQKCMDSRSRVMHATGHTYILGEPLFCSAQAPSRYHCWRTAPSRLALLSKEGWLRKILQPSASTCSFGARGSYVHSSTLPSAFVLEKIHPLYKVKKLMVLLVAFGSSNLLHWFQRNQPEVQNLRYKMYLELENQAFLHKFLNISQSFSQPSGNLLRTWHEEA